MSTCGGPGRGKRPLLWQSSDSVPLLPILVSAGSQGHWPLFSSEVEGVFCGRKTAVHGDEQFEAFIIVIR